MRYAVLILLTACAGGGEVSSGPTAADFEQVQTQVHGMQPWAEAETALKGALGEPMSTEGDVWTWQTGGDACSRLSVTKMGSVVGTISVAPCS